MEREERRDGGHWEWSMNGLEEESVSGSTGRVFVNWRRENSLGDGSRRGSIEPRIGVVGKW